MTPKELADFKTAIRGERMCVSVAGIGDRHFVAVFDDGTIWMNILLHNGNNCPHVAAHSSAGGRIMTGSLSEQRRKRAENERDAMRAERDAAVVRAEKYNDQAASTIKGLLAEVAALTAERKQIQFDVQPLQDIAPATAWGQNVCAWAAEHIVALTADNERLRGALRVFVERADWCAKSGIREQTEAVSVFRDRIEAARAALARRATEGTP